LEKALSSSVADCPFGTSDGAWSQLVLKLSSTLFDCAGEYIAAYDENPESRILPDIRTQTESMGVPIKTFQLFIFLKPEDPFTNLPFCIQNN
jgi:hypothetical protein